VHELHIKVVWGMEKKEERFCFRGGWLEVEAEIEAEIEAEVEAEVEKAEVEKAEVEKAEVEKAEVEAEVECQCVSLENSKHLFF